MAGNSNGPTGPPSGAHLEQQLMIQAQGLLGGLQAAMYAPRAYELSPGVDGSLGYNNCLCRVHCFRSVSQRKLSNPRRFCFNVTTGGGADIIDDIITNTQAAGGLEITPGDETNPGVGLTFYDANSEAERGEIEDLVLFALRVTCCLNFVSSAPTNPQGTAGEVASITDFDGLNDAICCALLQQLGVRIFASADRNSPMIDWTPLSYFVNNGQFVPIPAILWNDRDPKVLLEARFSFNDNTALCPIPAPANGGITSGLLSIEGLWAPDPTVCGNEWPGGLCEPHTICRDRRFFKVQ